MIRLQAAFKSLLNTALNTALKTALNIVAVLILVTIMVVSAAASPAIASSSDASLSAALSTPPTSLDSPSGGLAKDLLGKDGKPLEKSVEKGYGLDLERLKKAESDINQSLSKTRKRGGSGKIEVKVDVKK